MSDDRLSMGGGGHTLFETRDEIQKYLDMELDIQHKSPTMVRFRMLVIDCQVVKSELASKARGMAAGLMQGLADQVRQDSEYIAEEFKDMLKRLKKVSATVEDLAELKGYSKAVEAVEIPRLLTVTLITLITLITNNPNNPNKPNNPYNLITLITLITPS